MKYKNILNTGIIRINREKVVEYIDFPEQYFLETPETILGKKIDEITILNSDDILSVTEDVIQGKPAMRRTSIMDKGKNKLLLVKGEPISDTRGKVHHGIILFLDITELTGQYNLFLQKSNNLATIINSLLTGIIITDYQHKRILFTNRSGREMLKRIRKKGGGMPQQLQIPSGGKKEIKIDSKEGKTLNIEIQAKKIHWFGQYVFLYTLHDISHLKVAEQQNALLLTAIQSSANGIVITNNKMIVEWCNPAFLKLSGKSLMEVLGQNISETLNILPESDESYTCDFENTIRKNNLFQTKIRHTQKDGSTYECELTVTPFIDHSSGNKKYIFDFNDITAIIEKEKILTILNRVFNSLIKANSLKESFIIFRDELKKNNLHSIIYLLDQEKEILIPRYFSFQNEVLEKFQELIDRPLDSLKIPLGIAKKHKKIFQEKTTVFSPDVAGDLFDILPPIHNEKEIREFFRSTGIRHSISAPIMNYEEKVIGIFQLLSDHLDEHNVQEITAFSNHISFFFQKIQLLEELRKQYEKLKISYGKLKISEKQYRDLFNNDLTGDYISTPEGKFLDCNQNFARILGFLSKEEVLASDPRDLFEKSETRETILRQLKEEKKVENYEVELIRKDGKKIHVLLNAYGILDDTGNLVRTTGYIFDITKRKEYERDLILSKEKAEEHNRLKSAFLANMSHEIRTPLNAIMGFSELMQNEDLSTEERKEYINLINTAGHQLMHILKQILEISRIESGELSSQKKPMDIHLFLKEILVYFSSDKLLLSKHLKIFCDNTLTGKKILISDKERLHNIFQNLIRNAIKFTPSGSIHFGYEISEDHKIRFYVRDTGIGIHYENKNRIFERFRQEDNSLTREYEGIGLGLSITKELVKMLGGEIWVESEPGKGSTFYFSLPYVSKE